MENNSLFKTRQLSKYRAWTGNKKGCLFYVPFPDYDDAGGAICLIDAPWRENDEVGSYNKLHQCELKMAEENCVLCGYGAFLIQWEWANGNSKDVAEAWRVYCEWVEKATGVIYDNSFELLVEECGKLLKRHHGILNEWGMDDLQNAGKVYSLCCTTIRYVVEQLLDDMPSMMFDIEPYIGYYPKIDETECLLAPQVKRIEGGNIDGYEPLCGFCGAIVNYLAAFYVFDNLLWRFNGDVDDEEWINNAFMIEGVRHTISYSDVMSNFQEPDIQPMLDCYRQKKEESVTDNLKKDIRYVACRSEESKRFLIIQTMFEEEIQDFPDFDDKEYDYLEEYAKNYLKNLYISYMLDLLEQLQNSLYYDNDKKILLECFPEELSQMAFVENDQQRNIASSYIEKKPFKYLTRKCYDENKVQLVESELEAAIAESDPAIWDCLYRYINLGYIENLDPIKSSQILKAIKNRFGEKKRSYRNFNIARQNAQFQHNL